MTPYYIASFYKFAELPDFADFREPLLAACQQHGVLGTILLAEEGINGTIAGAETAVLAVLASLKQDARLAALTHKASYAEKAPFYRAKVKLKKEIVTLGAGDLNPARNAGRYVKPEDWNELIQQDEVTVIDTRNDYEVAIGAFKNAINPQTTSFRELPAWLAAQDKLDKKQKIAMYCTGGIRCEKSTALLKEHGFEEVFHLEGGILKYLEHVPEAESLWDGECFVFDERVSVRHGLRPGNYKLCRACRHPLDETALQSAHYMEGVSCQYCFDKKAPEDKARFAERQKQCELAKQRNQRHVGATIKPKPEKKEASNG